MPGEQRQPRGGTEWSVLALLCERPSHGFALARALAPEGEVGRVWSSTRPLVYRAVDQLVAAGLVRPAGVEASDRGPRRTLLEPTDQGRAELAAWLQRPLEHVRELRTELMLKLLFHDRTGSDAGPLLRAQRDRLETIVAALDGQAARAGGFERTLVLWRREAALAALRFVEGALA